MNTRNIIFGLLIPVLSLTGNQPELKAQANGNEQNPTLIITSEPMVEVPSIASQVSDGTFIPAEDHVKEFNPKRWGSNTSVPGKGFPKGNDPLWEKQTQAVKSSGKAPILTFEAASSSSTPTDPTGAVGPDHFLNSWNTAFRIWDKAGNPLTAAASLGTIFPGTMGDPIVLYDRYADRFLISEFYSNGFYVGISQGPDPLNDGWYTYTFPTNTFPDYPKFSVWSDGYYITANKDQNTASTSQVVFVVDRDKMLVGNSTAQMIGFPLTNIVTSGFYSPLGFHCNGPELPPPGNAPIVYMQDDVWSGVSTDHLKIWSINVNWTTPASSTISSPQIINTTPFDGLFDNGSFSNLPQPSGSDIDCLQATIMYMAHYRRFPTYNTVVFNFVVDLNGADNYSGIRWYELRQNGDGNPWTIHQEGTYAQPNGHSAFSGNMCMDANGNIGLAYTTVSTTLFPSLRFTGRYASDPLGTMTLAEEVIANGTQSDPSFRYGDYSQMTIDPVDDATFWSIGEYFNGGRKNHVGVFQIAPPPLTAQFTASPEVVCSGSAVNFTDQSYGSPSTWEWTFPGGTPSTYYGQNPPPVVYTSPGNYDVSLTVGDGVNTNTLTISEFIAVASLIADFTGIPESVVVGNSVTFTDESSCNPVTWSWTFEGGNPATFSGQYPPPVFYTTEGTYDVTLTVTKPGYTDTKIATDFIHVIPPNFNMQNGTITTCAGTFYDAGGSSSYANNEDFVLTFFPSEAGNQLEFQFTQFSVENQSSCNYDYLNIYNGTNTSAPLIGKYCGTNSPGTISSNNPEGAITFQWHSDGSVVAAGWTATINCIETPPVTYCIPTYTSGSVAGDYISLVQLGDINNATGASASPYYTYYSSLSTDLVQGENYTLTLSPGTYSSGNYIAAWIDFNNDGTFDEGSEKLGTILIPPMPATGTISFTVPEGAAAGISRLRVREVWNVSNFNACSTYGYGETEDYNVNILGSDLRIQLTAYLEGPFNGTTMDANLQSLIPEDQPFDLAPWDYSGSENVPSIPNADVVDWVLVELRDAASASQATGVTTIARKAAFILFNGSVVDLDGTSNLEFAVSVNQNLYVVLWHRNHLGILSNNALVQSGGIYTYDFSTGVNQAYGGAAGHKEIVPGVWGMFSGDGDRNGTIGEEDKSPLWENEAGTTGYIPTDYNLDGQSDNTDKDEFWLPNLMMGSEVPD